MRKITIILILTCCLLFAIPNTMVEAKNGVGSEILTVDEILLMAAAMELENGMNSDRCLMLTGSVILNRRNSPEWPDTVEGVLFQKGQYAEHTRKHLYTVKVTDRVMCLALKLAMKGSVDKEIIFQSMHPELGKVKYHVDTEYFATAK